jgi:arsenate reductase
MLKVYNVLFLCTGNSARSILAEALLQRWSDGRFRSYSAGTHPQGCVHPEALRLLQLNNFLTAPFRSKGRDEFLKPDAPEMDFVFALSDEAVDQMLPPWPGRPIIAHWKIDDPDRAVMPGERQREAFRRVYWELNNRIRIFCLLPLDRIDRISLQIRLDDMGRFRSHSASAA